MEYPKSSNQFFYDTSIVDYQPHYILRFDEIEVDTILITKDNFTFQYQDNNKILLFIDGSFINSIDFDKFAGFVRPKCDDIGIYGNIEFVNDTYRDMYQLNNHNIRFYPVGNWIFNFDTNVYEEYNMYGLNMILKHDL